MKDVIVVIGSGSIAQAIARRVSVGKHILLANIKSENAQHAENTFSRAGFDVSTTAVDVSSRQSIQQLVKTACDLGNIKGIIHGTPDEIGALVELLFGPSGTYITGSDLLIDGGATASYKYGDLRPVKFTEDVQCNLHVPDQPWRGI